MNVVGTNPHPDFGRLCCPYQLIQLNGSQGHRVSPLFLPFFFVFIAVSVSPPHPLLSRIHWHFDGWEMSSKSGNIAFAHKWIDLVASWLRVFYCFAFRAGTHTHTHTQYNDQFCNLETTQSNRKKSRQDFSSHEVVHPRALLITAFVALCAKLKTCIFVNCLQSNTSIIYNKTHDI